MTISNVIMHSGLFRYKVEARNRGSLRKPWIMLETSPLRKRLPQSLSDQAAPVMNEPPMVGLEHCRNLLLYGLLAIHQDPYHPPPARKVASACWCRSVSSLTNASM